MATYSWMNSTAGVKNRQVLFIALAQKIGNNYKTWFRGANRDIAERICADLHNSFAIGSNKPFSFAAFEQQYNFLRQADTSNITASLLGQYAEVVADAAAVGLLSADQTQAIQANFANIKVAPIAAKKAKIVVKAAMINQQDALAAAGRALRDAPKSPAFVALVRETIIAQLSYFRSVDDAAALALEMVRK